MMIEPQEPVGDELTGIHVGSKDEVIEIIHLTSPFVDGPETSPIAPEAM